MSGYPDETQSLMFEYYIKILKIDLDPLGRVSPSLIQPLLDFYIKHYFYVY